MISIYIEPAALSDIEDASVWYESKQPGLGIEFILELDRLLERIATNPKAFNQVYRFIRRALLRRFPYALYFIDDDVTLHLYAVLHQSRAIELVSLRLE